MRAAVAICQEKGLHRPADYDRVVEKIRAGKRKYAKRFTDELGKLRYAKAKAAEDERRRYAAA
jgi:hypothetical protein